MQRVSYTIGLLVALSIGSSSALAAAPVIENADSRWENKTILRVIDFNRNRPPVLTFDDSKSVKSCKLDSAPCPKNHRMELLPFPGRPRGRIFTLTWIDGDGEHEASVKLLDRIPSDFSIEGRSVLKKNVFLAVGTLLLSLSPEGEIDFYRESSFPTVDFRPVKVGGKRFYSFGQIRQVNEAVNSEGMHWVLDQDFELFDVQSRISDNHEFLFLGPKHFVFTHYEDSAKEGEPCVLRQSVIESKNGRDVYVLDSDELVKLGILPAYGVPPVRKSIRTKIRYHGRECLQNDHLNAVEIVDRNRWLVSFGESTVFMWLKKERRAEWVFGGVGDQFKLTAEQKTALHHTPHWFEKEKRLILFDNGLENKRSRVVEYFLDFKSGKVRAMKQHDLGGAFSTSAGSVEVDGDVLSVGFGNRENSKNDFVELSSGTQTMAIRVCSNCDKLWIYRFYRGDVREPARR